jgi:hypothetical protein
VSPGTYHVSEDANPAGWDLSDISCGDDSDSSVDLKNRTATINVSALEDVTCTFTTRKAPKLTLNKIVVNDNGGTRSESDWTLTADGGAAGVLTGKGAPGSADVVSGAGFKPGTYTLSESGPSGYTAGAWSCTSGTQNGNQITLDYGQDVTCTITNDDTAPKLTLDKVVVNDNGGTRTESDWTLTANGGTAGALTGPGAAGHTDVVSGPGFKPGT